MKNLIAGLGLSVSLVAAGPSLAGLDTIPDTVPEAVQCGDVNGIFVPAQGIGADIASVGLSPLQNIGSITIEMSEGDVLNIVTQGDAFIGNLIFNGDYITERTSTGRDYEAVRTITTAWAVLSSSIAPGAFSEGSALSPQVTAVLSGATFTCTPADGGSEEETVEQTVASGVASTRVKTTGLGFRADAGGGATGSSGSGNGTSVDIDLDQSGGSAMLSQSGDSGWTAWLALELRKFDGDYDGNAFNFAGGADYQVTDTAAIGAMISFGQSDLDGGFGDFESSNRGIGPYFLYDFSNGLSAEGFLVFEDVAYESAGGEFNADRLSYGLTLKGSAEMGGLDVTPFLRLEGFNEDQEAYAAVAQNDVTYRTLSAGARIDFDMGDFDPYLSLALENRRLTSESSPDENFNAPRLGFGFDYATSDSSILSVDIDAGKVLEDTRDYGLILTYEVDF